MGMFDSFELKVKCPSCGNEEIIEFQTKNFSCTMEVWKEGDEFLTEGISITEGRITEVPGGCKVKGVPDCGREWEKKNRPNCHGFGRPIVCDVVIRSGFVDRAVNLKVRDKDE